MTTVFLSGSRKISRLNDMIRSRIQKMIDQRLHIVIGDANGADKALQRYLADQSYWNVSVFCAGQYCRNNIGGWKVNEVLVDPKLRGRAFYTQKDKEMASKADYGFVLWDGKSTGSLNNMCELLKNGKKTAVYLSPEKRFVNITSSSAIHTLIQHCKPSDFRALNKALETHDQLQALQSSSQATLNL